MFSSPDPSRLAVSYLWTPLAAVFLLTAVFPGVAAGESAAERERDLRWRERNSPAAEAEAAKAFAGILNVGADFQQSGLASRVELRPLAEMVKNGQDREALLAYENLFYQKLQSPVENGIPPDLVSPFVKGIGGIGEWPAVLWNPKTPRAEVIAAADLLLQGKADIGGKTVDLGPPGRVNWYYPLPYGEMADPEKPDALPNPAVASGQILQPLARAFVLTKDPKYLRAWQAYMEDWSLNATYLDRVHPCFVPSVINASAYAGIGLIKTLAAVQTALPENERPLPSLTFARTLERMLVEYPLLSQAYIRSNTHNWTPTSSAMALAMIGDELISSPLLFRENKRRSIEDNAVTQNLRDGSENQQCPWYNDNYHSVLGAVRLMEARERMPAWREVEWVKEALEEPRWMEEIREHLRDRVNFQIRLRTPQGEWPIAFRGGDKRQANKASWVVSPEAYADPLNRGVLDAAAGGGAEPGYRSDWFPYGGYTLIREGWGPRSGYAAMFASPKPGAYGGYRSRSNNNVLCLAADAQDLLIDDTVGHYMYPTSPIRVDGMNQNFHAGEGIYKVDGAAAHKSYLVSAWTDPAPWRWHSSDRFDVAEGIYEGIYADPEAPVSAKGLYGPDESQQSGGVVGAVRDVRHQRIVQYLRSSGLWIVTDRMRSPASHAFTQVWMFPLQPSKHPAFEVKDFVLDAQRQIISTESAAEVQVQGKPAPKANISLFQFSSQPLQYRSRIVPTEEKNRYMMYGRNEVQARWTASGPSQVITLIQPRPGGRAALQNVRPVQAGEGVAGFETVDAEGQPIHYVSAADGTADLVAGPVRARAESLLLTGRTGIVLGATEWAVQGRTTPLPSADFEFALDEKGGVTTQIISRPIDPVAIHPAANVFVDGAEISLSSRTPGVEIHYTLDGSEPLPSSARYQGPFRITDRTVVKARAYRPGQTANPTNTAGVDASPVSTALFVRETLLPAVTGVKPKGDGLRFRYWEDDWKTLWMKGSELKPLVDDRAKGLFDLALVPATNPPLGEAAAPRQKYYAVEYSGFLDVPADGVYTFEAPREFVYPDTEAGYDLRLFVGNKMGRPPFASRVMGLQEWYPSTRLHGLGSWSIALQKGLQPFRVYFLDYRTDAPQKLNKPGMRPYVWPGAVPEILVSGPGLDRQPIPTSWFKY